MISSKLSGVRGFNPIFNVPSNESIFNCSNLYSILSILIGGCSPNSFIFCVEVLVRFFQAEQCVLLAVEYHRRHLLNILMYLLNIVHVIHLQSPRFPYLLIKKIVIYIHMAMKVVTCPSLSRAGGVNDCEKELGSACAGSGSKGRRRNRSKNAFFVSVGAAPVNPPVLKRFEFGLMTPTLPI